MYKDEKLELKVGLFIGIGFFVAFLLVVSIKDFSMMGKHYYLNVVFDFVNGINVNSPVRVAGVSAGEVKNIQVYYDDKVARTRIKLSMVIKNDFRLEEDSAFRINKLGLLGEQYIEVSPGKAKTFIQPNATVEGKNPMNVGEEMEKWNELFVSLNFIVQKIKNGDGTFGKLIVDDKLYNDFESVFSKISKGEGTLGKLIADDKVYKNMDSILTDIKEGKGTIGKLIVEDKIYNEAESAVSDIKENPWKLVYKTKDTKAKKR
ncbi:MAG: MCE family protein [Candidatus Omnitrophica bacterium]|nr:MCE family protein [Candidatus Omnitrophota bacterium]